MYEQTTKGLVSDVLRGFNVTVFAYGATGELNSTSLCSITSSKLTSLIVGAGKTFTMLGTSKQLGIMVRALNDLFQEIEDTKEDYIYCIKMSYLEVHSEN